MVKPELLRWARESIGLDVSAAAHKLGIDEAKLLACEEGRDRLTMAKLERAADVVYRRPLAVFFLPAPPEEFQVVKDFRRLPGAPSAPSPELTVELRKAGARRAIALEMLDELGEAAPNFDLRASRKEAAQAAAARVRAALGISVEEQLDWRDAYVAYRTWRAAVEEHGVLVFQITGVPVNQTRGFSTFYEELPVIAVNGKDAPTARCFTLMHELGHLLRRGGSVCNWSERDAEEVWCNRFAGELLVPSEALRAEVVDLIHHDEWPDPVLTRLSRRFGVSPEVIVRRLVTIRRATQDFYQRWRDERGDESPPAGGGPVPVSKRVVAHAGSTFVSLVLSAYHADRITASTLSNYLGAKLKHLPAIEALMIGGDAG